MSVVMERLIILISVINTARFVHTQITTCWSLGKL